ncbi:hypothetical protein PPYR_11704 [Photinus pyralis]|uniref:Uncharacterized protein n=1 Tax=Photinus pyralis TaxID=7054 RepID=A0A1Y1LSZ8_PHOPY|nr:uncharacterized protein LOC116175319 [Photinus pyralis]XP_031351526.1 uncharacterized protein LOC116176857 [Photinus pyralis]KAB0794865.1 hypothetical protein PPYR_11704 [Photinus pyralis]
MAQAQNDCERRQELVRQLKCVVDEIVKVDCSKKPTPAFRQCLIAVDPTRQQPPDVMVCYKTKSTPPVNKVKQNVEQTEILNKPNVVVTCKSRELLGGILYVGCDCGKKNGLQDDCRRTQCQGSPACLAKPEPTCCPSQYSNAKHLVSKMFKNESKTKGQQENVTSADGNAKDNCNEYLCFPAVIDCCACCL